MNDASSIVIRPATAADAPALGRLGALLVALHHEFDPERFIAAGPDTEEGYGDFLRSQVDAPGAVVLVAEAAGQVVGYAYGGVEGHDWMALRGPAGVVYDLVVDPGRRREGLGRRLLDAVIDALMTRGAPRVVLTAADRNAAAQRLFASAGFRRTMVEMTRDAPARP